MPTDDLRFDIQEKPSWRAGQGSSRTSSQLLKEVVEWKEKFNSLSKEEISTFEESFRMCMNVEYVYHSNLAEDVGLQSHEDTKQALERVFGLRRKAGGEMSVNELETINTAKAYMGLRNVHQQNGSNGKLFLRDICGIHQLLMNELRPDAGRLRISDTHVRLPNNTFQFFCKPEVSQARILGLLHQHNIHMETFMLGSSSWKLGDQYAALIKSAAWLIAQLLDIHPFSDGNGRMGWLLVNYCLSLINPFPTHLYDFNGSQSSVRKSQFAGAMENFRKSPKDGPKEVAALILEGLWSGWSKFFKAFEARKLASNTIYVIFQKSQADELEERVKEIQIAKHLGVSEAEAVAMVQDMVGRVNVSTSQHQQYTQMKLDSVSQLTVYIRVFP